MSNIRQLATACCVVANSSDFECSDVFGAVLPAIMFVPVEFQDMVVIRFVKNAAAVRSAVTRAIEKHEFVTGDWHYVFYCDRDNTEIRRCVCYNERVAQHSEPLNPKYGSVSIQYRPKLASYNAFLRTNAITVLKTVEKEDWKIAAYTSTMGNCYRIVCTGPAEVTKIPDFGQTEGIQAEQYTSDLTHVFKCLR